MTLAVMSTLGIMVPLRDSIGPDFEAATGTALDISFDPTAVILGRVNGGHRADVVVAMDTAVDALIAEGVLLADTRTDVARTAVGLAKPPGSPAIDISTPEAFIRALLDTPRLVISEAGASGIYFRELIERLGIRDAIMAKALVIPKGLTAEKLLTGEATLAVQQMSELMAVPGIDMVGAFPQPLGTYAPFVAAVFAGSAQPETAQNFISHLLGEGARRAFLATGVEPA
ncbi:ABC transporter substrate-binding protein [Rhodovarius crocodyli]|uniref:ABC transporter substrate-binding protein n=1 Tax=Rhodovarius crocodyli TaxID=1979269 RepID=A0A437MH23_9PROT|nr:substrate-binding domain-containing protein [Rhodovarius crocodyli]RVT96954.1 ABC transporter substrate-binding protein [Rhodovarius crocodyli]